MLKLLSASPAYYCHYQQLCTLSLDAFAALFLFFLSLNTVGRFYLFIFQQTCFVLAAAYYSYDCTYLHLETATDISPLVAEMLHWDICQFNCLLKAMGSADVSGADRAFLVPYRGQKQSFLDFLRYQNTVL